MGLERRDGDEAVAWVQRVTLDQAIANGEVKLEGKKEAVSEFLALLDHFDLWFNIVTP